jgi:hypothetical protein
MKILTILPLSILIVFVSASCVGVTEQTANQGLIQTSIKVGKKIEIDQKEIIDIYYSPAPRIGTVDELKNDKNCGKKNINGFVETENEKIYLCGNEKIFNSLIIIPKNSKSPSMIIKQEPFQFSYSFQFKDLNFRQGNILYIISPPSGIHRSSSFSIYDDSEKRLIYIARVSAYLFNKRTNPNYSRSLLTPDKSAKEKFLSFLPSLAKKTPLCDISEKGIGKIPKNLSAFEIAPKKYLVEAICFGTGYNPIFQYYLYSEESLKQQAKIIPFDTLDPGLIESGNVQKTELMTISGLPQFFPEDNTLRVFHKGIGAGGCGYASEYKLTGDRFELLEFRKYDCFGYKSPKDWKSKSPSEFPKIYP